MNNSGSKSKKALIYKVAVLLAVLVEIIALVYMGVTNKDGGAELVYKYYVIFGVVDLVIVGAVEIFKDIRSRDEIFIKDFIFSRIRHWGQIQSIGFARLKQRYTGTALGWFWAVIRPSMTIFIFWFGITLGLRRGGNIGEYPYFLWLIAGFIPWFYMSDMINQGAGCIRNNAYLLKVAKFPVITIPTITSLSLLPVHLILVAATIVIFIVSGHPLTIYIIQLPLYMLMMVVLFDFWGLLAGTLSTISRDFQNLINAIITCLFWLSGIVYNVAELPNAWLKMILSLNPIACIVMGYRHCLIDKLWFFQTPEELINYGIMLGVMIILATKAYKKFGKILPDMI